MKESTDMTRKTEMESLPGLVETFIKVSTVKMRGMEMARCSGLMAACMKENGAEVSNMVSAGCYSQMEHKKKDISKITFSSTPFLETTAAIPQAWRAPMATLLSTSTSKWDLQKQVRASRLTPWTKIIHINSISWQGITIHRKVRKLVLRLRSRIYTKIYLFPIFSQGIIEENQSKRSQSCENS